MPLTEAAAVGEILCGCTCDEIIPVPTEAGEEDNRLKETEGGAVEPTSPLPPPTEPPAPVDPCEGKEGKPPAINAFVHPYVFNRNWTVQPSVFRGRWARLVLTNYNNLSMKLNCATNVQHKQRDAIKR